MSMSCVDCECVVLLMKGHMNLHSICQFVWLTVIQLSQLFSTDNRELSIILEKVFFVGIDFNAIFGRGWTEAKKAFHFFSFHKI